MNNTGHQISLNDSLTTVARISHQTGNIEVHSDFYNLDEKIQDFILTHIRYRYDLHEKITKPEKEINGIKVVWDEKHLKSKDDIEFKLAADEYALNVMKAKYPEVDENFWGKGLANIICNPHSAPDDCSRLDHI